MVLSYPGGDPRRRDDPRGPMPVSVPRKGGTRPNQRLKLPGAAVPGFPCSNVLADGPGGLGRTMRRPDGCLLVSDWVQ